MSPLNSSTVRRAVRVWDLPTRLLHWLLAATVIALVVTGKVGGNATVWHMRMGCAVLGMLVFRLVWGFAGGHWSRFASFVRGPATVLRHLRGLSRTDEHHDVGHSPLGALSVLAMLVVLSLQVATGLVADDEIASTGPLNRYVSSATAAAATHWHKDYGQVLLILLVVLHVAAIVYYRVRHHRNLVQPMLTGDKLLSRDVPASMDNRRTRSAAAALALLCALLAVTVARLGS